MAYQNNMKPSEMTPVQAADALDEIVQQSHDLSKTFQHTVADLGRHVDYLKVKSKIRTDRV